jgi:hypothetical protein
VRGRSAHGRTAGCCCLLVPLLTGKPCHTTCKWCKAALLCWNATAAALYLRRAPADPHVVWPDMRPVDIPEGGELPLVLPPAAYAFDFVLAHSQPDDNEDLVTGLYCYAELVLQQVGCGCVYQRLTVFPGPAQ